MWVWEKLFKIIVLRSVETGAQYNSEVLGLQGMGEVRKCDFTRHPHNRKIAPVLCQFYGDIENSIALPKSYGWSAW